MTTPDDQPNALSFDDLRMITDGLVQLDGYDRLAKDGAREFVVKEFYKFGKGLRALIAKNIATSRPVLRALNDRNNALVEQYAEGTGKVTDKNKPEFTAEQNKMINAASGVVLQRIKLDELKLDDNPIPASTLSLLSPILDD